MRTIFNMQNVEKFQIKGEQTTFEEAKRITKVVGLTALAAFMGQRYIEMKGGAQYSNLQDSNGLYFLCPLNKEKFLPFINTCFEMAGVNCTCKNLAIDYSYIRNDRGEIIYTENEEGKRVPCQDMTKPYYHAGKTVIKCSRSEIVHPIISLCVDKATLGKSLEELIPLKNPDGTLKSEEEVFNILNALTDSESPLYTSIPEGCVFFLLHNAGTFNMDIVDIDA